MSTWVGQYAPLELFFGLPKIVPTSPSRHMIWKSFVRELTLAEVIRVHTLNFWPNFKIYAIVFFGEGTPSEFGCALARLGQSLERVKI